MSNMEALRRTSRLATGAAICLTLIAVSVSYGALSHQAGFALWQTVLFAALAYGGAAEMLYVSTIGAGGAPVTAALGGILVNIRNLAYGMNVGTFAPGGWRSVVAAHLVNDETAAFSRTGQDAADRWTRFHVLGAAMLCCWVGGAAGGQLLAGSVDTGMFGFDSAFPVILVAMVMPDLRSRPMAITAVVAVVLSVVLVPVLPPGLAAPASLVALVPWVLAARGGLPGGDR